MNIVEATLDLSHVTSKDAIVHTIPFPGPHTMGVPQMRFACTADLTMADVPSGVRTVIVGTSPVSAEELVALRDLFASNLETMKEAAEAQGGSGFILGSDPLSPDDRVDQADLGFTNEAVFIWSRPPGAPALFDWRDVCHMNVTELSIEVFLVNGATIFIHADIDWWNLLG